MKIIAFEKEAGIAKSVPDQDLLKTKPAMFINYTSLDTSGKFISMSIIRQY